MEKSSGSVIAVQPEMEKMEEGILNVIENS